MAHVRTPGDIEVKLNAIAGEHSAQLTIEGTRLRYEREGANTIEREFSITPLDPGAYSVLIDGRSYTVIAARRVENSVEISVNGRRFSIEIFDPRELGERKLAGTGAGRQNIVAMMPGKVVRVIAAIGDTVEAGQGLIVVEAMKMQNEMVAPRAGRVAQVKTEADATVSAGEVLMVIE
jgi:biotin carboxyl carrier protein